MNRKAAARVEVYRYKRCGPHPEFLPEWGTLEAIASLDRCIAIRPTRCVVDARRLDPDGFLPFGTAPDEVVR